MGLAVIMQKVYIISSMLLVLGLEYFTKLEDFKQIKLGEQKIQVTNRLQDIFKSRPDGSN